MSTRPLASPRALEAVCRTIEPGIPHRLSCAFVARHRSCLTLRARIQRYHRSPLVLSAFQPAMTQLRLIPRPWVVLRARWVPPVSALLQDFGCSQEPISTDAGRGAQVADALCLPCHATSPTHQRSRRSTLFSAGIRRPSVSQRWQRHRPCLLFPRLYLRWRPSLAAEKARSRHVWGAFAAFARPRRVSWQPRSRSPFQRRQAMPTRDLYASSLTVYLAFYRSANSSGCRTFSLRYHTRISAGSCLPRFSQLFAER